MRSIKTNALSFLLLGALVATMPACKKKEGCTDPAATNYDADAEDNCCCEYATASDKVVIDQPIAANTTWTSDKKYLIKGFIEVESGYTLTIEAGTKIFGDKASKGTLIINRGAKLQAVGTANEPIIFTSNASAGNRAPGDWGGLVICGKAPVNLPGGIGVVEGGLDAVFGGTEPTDTSGTLQYVRIEYPGIAFQTNNEINGLTLAGVGSGTVIDHVQVSYSGDDSFEWFGGTVNCKNLVAFGGLDDDFDMDNGYSGKVQFCVALRDPEQADVSGSNGLEHDNDASGSGATPYTTPVLSNISIYGPQATPSTTVNSNYKRSNHLRRNTHSRVFNSVFAGFPVGLLVDGGSCETNADANELKVKDCVYSAMGTLTAVASGSTWDIATWFTNGNNTTYTDNAQLGVNDAFNLSAPDFTLSGSSPLATGASFSDGDLSDPFITNVSYKGAFGSDNWTAAWANWTPQSTTY